MRTIWSGFLLLLFALALLLFVPFISERLTPPPKPLPSRNEPNLMGLTPDELREFLIGRLGERTSYGLPRVSMVDVGNNLSINVKNATREILGQIDFNRFAVARIVLEGHDHRSKELGMLRDLAAVYSAIFKRFERLDGMLIFVESPLSDKEGKGTLKSVAVAYMSRAAAEKVDWDSISYEDVLSTLDYFAWIHPDF